MVELIDYIDSSVKDCIPEAKQFGLCHLIDGNEEKYPCTVERRATKAIPDDRFKILTYQRLLNGTPAERDDLSFGRGRVLENSQKIKMVIFIKLEEDQTLIDDIFNSLPTKSFETSNYYNASVSGNTTLFRDRAVIWADEYSKAYQDKYQMVWRVYAIDYELKYLRCNVCV